MKRRLVAAALVLVFPFGMAACGAQSKEAACKQIQKAATTASSEINFDSNSDGKDIKENLDKALKIYKKAAKKVTNNDVKAAYADVITDMDKLADAMNNGADFYESDEVLDLTTELSAHGEKLNELCGFSWDR